MRVVESFRVESPEPGRLGGKAESLCRLARSGHRVPPGFIVTVDAFRTSCIALGLSDLVAELSEALAGSDPLESEKILDALASRPLPSPVLEPILARVEELAPWEGGAGGLIVRSSATVEDGASHSFAGIFESILVDAPEVLEPTIRKVWSSVFQPRALSYCREVGLQQLPAMALVIQRFLLAERSGVMFTAYPGADGGSRTLIEHVEGGCDKLVRGEVTPEQIWLERPAELPDTLEGKLAAKHARELARLAARLEEAFGGPQDVEWIIYEDEIHLVQTRPVTPPAARRGGRRSSTALEGVEPLLSGLPASGGCGSGSVHLVFNIEQALALERGQVLVTPMTNPDMVVAMRNSAAIVTDVGGMICHAAIVSRELGTPCVVGTERATTLLEEDEPLTVDGSNGAIYRGYVEIEAPVGPTRPIDWSDLWSVWTAAVGDRSDVVPMVSSIGVLRSLPNGFHRVVIVPDVDLRTDPSGLWMDLEGMGGEERAAAIESYLDGLADVAAEKALQRLYVLPLEDGLGRALADGVHDVGKGCLRLYREDEHAPTSVLDSRGQLAEATPVGVAALATVSAPVHSTPLSGMKEAREAALDTLRFFGHVPTRRVASMPSFSERRRWWTLLDEYGRFHRDFGTREEAGEFEWLEIRPELVISALLKSLVQPGFEMVPRVMGFRDLPPMHTKWIRCRYHFRSDVFERVWQAIVHGTWDPAYMAELMRRVRASYDRLAEILVLFPATDAELACIAPERIVALVTAWWPRWVEFFALCWFIQAQGDDILYPFIEETVADNLKRLGPPPGDFSWPALTDLIAPVTPVLSGEYMADVTHLREKLIGAGLTTTDQALAALEHGQNREVAHTVEKHLARWHWMRDRDLLFEPWDTPHRVIETALKTEPCRAVPYEANRERNALALSFHLDLSYAVGRAEGLNHAVRFLHDLHVERENHHLLWLKYSYPLRRLFLEVERRFVTVGSLDPGDVFFLQAPELIDAVRRLPAPLSEDLGARVRNRREGFLREARFEPAEASEPTPEDDYY